MAATHAGSRALDLLAQGSRRFQQHDWTQAETCYRKALAFDPRCADAHYNLAVLARELGRKSEALDCYRRALECSPAHFAAQANLGNLLIETGASADAIRHLERAIELRPEAAALLAPNLAIAYQQLQRLEEAAEVLRRAMADPSADTSLLYLNLANVLCEQNRAGEAVAAAREAVRLAPQLASARYTLGYALLQLGRGSESLAEMEQAVRLDPASPALHTMLVFQRNHHARTAGDAALEAERWTARHAAPLARFQRPHPNSPDPERRLKIGYVSPDFRRHPVAQFIEPVLAHHDRGRVEVFAYSSVPNPDDVTRTLETLVDQWRAIDGLSDEQAAELIRADGIDILVDLAGHTPGHRLLVFARKPAPVQATWIGYVNTTGLESIDYFLGDPYIPARAGAELLFRETVWRLPRSLGCFRHHATPEAVPVAPAPCLQRGYVTFGCFNNPAKITRQVVRTWSAILEGTPGSRLLLKYGTFASEAARKTYRDWFAEDGIDPARIDFQGRSPEIEYLAAHNGIDVALDPFPYNGGSSTINALWMGVPVVALAGPSPLQRVCLSLLAAAGLADLVVETEAQYVKTAIHVASMAPHLLALRAEIRAAWLSSSWTDEAGFTRDLEHAYRSMWRRWCAAIGCRRSGGNRTS